jgi:F0F1-type ATP synthase assembly protein I
MSKKSDDITDLERRIAKFKSANVIRKKKNDSLTNSRLFAKAFVLGTEFVGAVLVGVGLGLLLDRAFDTKFVFTVVFTMFGCIAGVLNMYRSVNDVENELK